jgi:hypothetical protein
MQTWKTAVEKFTKSTKGNINIMDLAISGTGLVVTGIVIATGLTILATYQASLVASSSSYNATGQAILGVAALANQMPTIGLVIAAAAIIGILFGAFMFLTGRQN